MKKTLIALLSVVGVICVVGGANVYINKVVADGGTVLKPVASAEKKLPPVFMAPIKHACFPTEVYFNMLKVKKLNPKIFITGEDEHGELVFVAEFPAIADKDGKPQVPPEVMVYTTMQEGRVVCILTALPTEGVDLRLKEMIKFFDPLKNYKAWSPSGGPAHEAKLQGDGGSFIYPSK